MIIYTDGACSNNGKEGSAAGWAFVVLGRDHEKIFECSGRVSPGTNNIGELLAIANALELLNSAKEWHVEPEPVTIYSDSMYCINGIKAWRHNWKKHNWTRNGKELKNADLWKKIDKLLGESFVPIQFEHIAGHSGHYWNEYVDKLAKAAI